GPVRQVEEVGVDRHPAGRLSLQHSCLLQFGTGRLDRLLPAGSYVLARGRRLRHEPDSRGGIHETATGLVENAGRVGGRALKQAGGRAGRGEFDREVEVRVAGEPGGEFGGVEPAVVVAIERRKELCSVTEIARSKEAGFRPAAGGEELLRGRRVV